MDGSQYSDIQKHVKQLLLAADIKEELPTPIDRLISCANLVEAGAIDLSQYKEHWISKGSNLLKSAFKKIIGILDYRTNIIYTSPDIHPTKKIFLNCHEVTHKILPWHESLLNPHFDLYSSLDPTTASELEFEANIGASMFQFQIDRFDNDAKDYQLSLNSAIHLAKIYDTSLHSTFRQYVHGSKKPCALLVLKKMENTNTETFLKLWYSIQSNNFIKKFGRIDWEKIYYKNNPIYDSIFSNSLETIKTGTMNLCYSVGGKTTFSFEVFSNGYNYFVLVFPKQKSIQNLTKVTIK